MIYAAFTVPAKLGSEDTRPYRKQNGFRGKARKAGEEDGYEIFRLVFEQPLKNRFYIALGSIVNRKWQDVEPVRIVGRDQAYVDVAVPVGHGCLLFLITPPG